MKKIVAFLAVFVMSVGLLAGCGSKSEESTTAASDAAAGEERTQLIVGFDAAFPPYGYKDDNGDYVGFDLSLAEEVCKRNNWELVKQPIDWDSKDMELSSQSIDCIWNGFTMNGREDDYTWSDPYVDNTQVFVVAKDSGIKTKEDLAGKVVLTQADSSALAALNDMPDLTGTFAELTQVGDYNTAFTDLESGSADAIAMDVAVAKFQIESRDNKYVILDDYISSEQYGIGFLKGNETLRDEVQATLMEMVDDGTFAKIAEDWGVSDLVCLGK